MPFGSSKIQSRLMAYADDFDEPVSPRTSAPAPFSHTQSHQARYQNRKPSLANPLINMPFALYRADTDSNDTPSQQTSGYVSLGDAPGKNGERGGGYRAFLPSVRLWRDSWGANGKIAKGWIGEARDEGEGTQMGAGEDERKKKRWVRGGGQVLGGMVVLGAIAGVVGLGVRAVVWMGGDGGLGGGLEKSL